MFIFPQCHTKECWLTQCITLLFSSMHPQVIVEDIDFPDALQPPRAAARSHHRWCEMEGSSNRQWPVYRRYGSFREIVTCCEVSNWDAAVETRDDKHWWGEPSWEIEGPERHRGLEFYVSIPESPYLFLCFKSNSSRPAIKGKQYYQKK